MAKFQVVGKRFGRLTVTGFVGTKGDAGKRAICKCDCGAVKEVYVYSLTRGATKSCGCYNVEAARQRSTTHGMTNTPTYRSWWHMKIRCLNPNNLLYPRYGARGIKVYSPWIASFAAFLADMEPCPEGSSLDRIDNNGDYTPENCRWATRLEQAQNTRRNVNITYKGRTMCAAAWARETGVPAQRLLRRIKDGWSPERALNPNPYPTL